ncbi:Ig-like domain-containing domain [Hymenobacter sp. BT491]|uniref:Ig-like domain-containing domain n=1 Tax=Hymenobacter sp. BT491 TaxID=2766779 RepID=UPI001653459D|nr:Ig-like domain-containing domain [Hymenobacter sp. BT491]MBC6991766.1 Ig-like domain-containing protein [Hymenobacter sp. BT491]
MFVRADLLLLLSVSSLLGGCAAVSSPEGGPRDTVAPKLVSTTPANGARNVKEQTVRLVFSESVQVKDLQKKLIVAPVIPDANHYKVREERNAISLTFEKPFDANTTYSFNFGDAVSDITESTPAKDVLFSFSTGPQLDSGSVRGVVHDLLTGQPANEASVILYPEADTLGVRRGKPYYLARTDKTGNFALRNLKEGKYRMYALADKNQSGRYEEGEKIAYLPDLLTVRPGVDSLRFELVRPDARKALITSQQPGFNNYKIGLNEGIQQASLTPLNASATTPELTEAVQMAEKGRSVILYKTPALPEGRYILATTDSVGNTGRDTLNVRFQGTAPARRGPAYSLEGGGREVYRQGQLRIQFNEPVRLAANKPFGTLVEDSTSRRPLRAPQDGSLNSERNQLIINLNTKAKNKISLVLDSTAITSVTGSRLGFRPIPLRLTEQSPFGTLSGTIQTKYKRYTLQLLDNTYQLVQSLDSPRNTFRFDFLTPGTYRIRVLIDADANGSWRGGDPKLLLPAEPVYIYPQTKQVRAGWEEEAIKLSF